jgi:hypothetical protein
MTGTDRWGRLVAKVIGEINGGLAGLMRPW